MIIQIMSVFLIFIASFAGLLFLPWTSPAKLSLQGEERSNWARSADQPSGSGHNWRGISFDAIVVSSGGTASSYFMGAMRGLNVTTNLRGRHTNPNFIYSLLKKKAIGERILTPQSLSIKKGIIYLMGDLLGSIISLTRRHYALSHTQLIGGDSKWMQELRYSNENPNQIVSTYSPLDDKNSNKMLHQISSQLFCIGREEEGNDLKLYKTGNTPRLSNGLKLNEALNGNHQVIVDRTLMRVREILAYTGRNKVDPIGIYNHFKKWHTFEREKAEEKNPIEEDERRKANEEDEMKLNKVPILFIMFDDIISSDKKTREAAEKALKKFLQFKTQFSFKNLSNEQKRKEFLGYLTTDKMKLNYKNEIEAGINQLNLLQEDLRKVANKVFYI